MKRYLPIALFVLALAGCGPGVPSSTSATTKPQQNQTTPATSKAPEQAVNLVDFTDETSKITFKVPEGWKQEKLTGGDWGGWKFTNPQDQNQFEKVVLSGCYGCSRDLNTGEPNVGSAIPKTHIIQKDVSADKTTATFSFRLDGNPHIGKGVVAVEPTTGYRYIEVVLPQDMDGIAKQIIDGFPLPEWSASAGNAQYPQTNTPQLQVSVPFTTQDALSRLPDKPLKTAIQKNENIYLKVPTALFTIVPFAVHMKAGESVWMYAGLYSITAPPLWQREYVFDSNGNMVAMWDWNQAYQDVPHFIGLAADYIPEAAKVYPAPGSNDAWVVQWHIIGGDMYVLSVSNPDWRKGMFDGVLYVPDGESGRIEVWPNLPSSK